jgi:AcrR family transcriptional regulator
MTSPVPPTPGGRTGTPAGRSRTRAAILQAARAAFGERGYAATSLRAVAAAAAVDPALVLHYFGSKQALFVAAIDLPIRPREVLPPVLAGDPATVGFRLVRFFVTPGTPWRPGTSSWP